MSNYINKIIYDGNTLIDLTEDTVTKESLILGKTAHGADGKLIVGTLEVGGGGDTSMEDGLVEGTLTEYENDRVTKIKDYTFYECLSLTAVSLPVATRVGNYTFYYRNNTTFNLPSTLETVGAYAFGTCSRRLNQG